MVRITRGIAPGTSISRAQISGTVSRPSRRAATAGNSASRSPVVVKRQLTIASARSSLRSSSSRINSSVAPTIASASLASACTAPRTAKRRSSLIAMTSRFRIFPEPADLNLLEPPRAPRRQRSQLDRAEADAAQRHHLVVDRLGHAAHLAVAPLAQDDLDLALAEAPHPRRRRHPVLQLETLGQPLEIPVRGRPPQLRPVGLLDFVARVGEPVR